MTTFFFFFIWSSTNMMMKHHCWIAFLLILLSSDSSRGDNGGLIVKLRYPAPGQAEWEPEEWMQVHVDIDLTEGMVADMVRAQPSMYSMCYHGYQTHSPPVCKPLVEGNIHVTKD
jgi:hypothetical protein